MEMPKDTRNDDGDNVAVIVQQGKKSSVAENDMSSNNEIAAINTPADVPAEFASLTLGSSENMLLPESFLSPSQEHEADSYCEGAEDLAWSIRFQPETDTILAGDSYLDKDPISTSTPAVKVGDYMRREALAGGDALSLLVEANENEMSLLSNETAEERKLSRSYISYPAELQSSSSDVQSPGTHTEDPSGVSDSKDHENQDDSLTDRINALLNETQHSGADTGSASASQPGDQPRPLELLQSYLSVDDKNQDTISNAEDTDSVDDYMPLEERVRLLLGDDGSNDNNDIFDNDDISLAYVKMDSQENPNTADILLQTPSEDNEPDITAEKQITVPVAHLTRLSGDGFAEQDKSASMSAVCTPARLSLSAGMLSTTQNTDSLLVNTGEHSLTSLEVASILANAEANVWTEQRSAAEGNAATEFRPLQVSYEDTVSCHATVSLSALPEGPDVRMGVGQESLAERHGISSEFSHENGEPDTFSKELNEGSEHNDSLTRKVNAILSRAPRNENTEAIARIRDREMDGASREVTGGYAAMLPEGPVDSSVVLSEHTTDRAFISRDISDTSLEIIQEDKNDEECEDFQTDHYLFERTVSGSSGSEDQIQIHDKSLSHPASMGDVEMPVHSDLETKDTPRSDVSGLYDNSHGDSLKQTMHDAPSPEKDDLQIYIATTEENEYRSMSDGTPRSEDIHKPSQDDLHISITTSESGSQANTDQYHRSFADSTSRSVKDDLHISIQTSENGSHANTQKYEASLTSDTPRSESDDISVTTSEGSRDKIYQQSDRLSPASSNTTDTLDLDVRQILRKYGRSLTDEDTDDQKSTGSRTHSEKDCELRDRVRRLLKDTHHDADTESISDLPSDSDGGEWMPVKPASPPHHEMLQAKADENVDRLTGKNPAVESTLYPQKVIESVGSPSVVYAQRVEAETESEWQEKAAAGAVAKSLNAPKSASPAEKLNLPKSASLAENLHPPKSASLAENLHQPKSASIAENLHPPKSSSIAENLHPPKSSSIAENLHPPKSASPADLPLGLEDLAGSTTPTPGSNLQGSRVFPDHRRHKYSPTSSTRSSSSSSINYDYLQRELDEIQQGLAQLQQYDTTFSSQAHASTSSVNSIRIADSDRESELGTPKKFSWDYAADLGVDRSAEGHFITRRRTLTFDQDASDGTESTRGSITPTRASGLYMDVYERDQPRSSNESETPASNPYKTRDELFSIGLRPSNMTAAQKVLARFAEEEKLRRKRLEDKKMEYAMELTVTHLPKQDASVAKKVQQLMHEESPTRQAYEYLDKAEHERHLQEMRENIHAQLQSSASSERFSRISLTPVPHLPLSALGTARWFLNSQLRKTHEEDFNDSVELKSPLKLPVEDKMHFNASEKVRHEIQEGQWSSTGQSPRSSEGQSPRSSEGQRPGSPAAEYEESDSDSEGDKTVVSRESRSEPDPSSPHDELRSPHDSGSLHDRLRSAEVTSPRTLQSSQDSHLVQSPRVNLSEDFSKYLYQSKENHHGMVKMPQSAYGRTAPQGYAEIPQQFTSTPYQPRYQSDTTTTVQELSSIAQVTRPSDMHTLSQNLLQRQNISNNNTEDVLKAQTIGTRYMPVSNESLTNRETPQEGQESKSPHAAQLTGVHRTAEFQHSTTPQSFAPRIVQDSTRSLQDTHSPQDRSSNSSKSPYDRSANSSRSSTHTPTNLRPYKPPGSKHLYYVDCDADDGTASITTMESTHFGSDDARGPDFAPGVYGSRQEPQSSVGIYHKKKSPRGASPTALDTIQENGTQDEKRNVEESSSYQKDRRADNGQQNVRGRTEKARDTGKAVKQTANQTEVLSYRPTAEPITEPHHKVNSPLLKNSLNDSWNNNNILITEDHKSFGTPRRSGVRENDTMGLDSSLEKSNIKSASSYSFLEHGSYYSPDAGNLQQSPRHSLGESPELSHHSFAKSHVLSQHSTGKPRSISLHSEEMPHDLSQHTLEKSTQETSRPGQSIAERERSWQAERKEDRSVPGLNPGINTTDRSRYMQALQQSSTVEARIKEAWPEKDFQPLQPDFETDTSPVSERSIQHLPPGDVSQHYYYSDRTVVDRTATWPADDMEHVSRSSETVSRSSETRPRAPERRSETGEPRSVTSPTSRTPLVAKVYSRPLEKYQAQTVLSSPHENRPSMNGYSQGDEYGRAYGDHEYARQGGSQGEDDFTALREDMSRSSGEYSQSPGSWQRDMPVDINDMWERFIQSKSFSESEPETNVDLSRLYSLIRDPVRHLWEELRNERRERKHLEQQLLEDRRQQERKIRHSGSKDSKPGKSRQAELNESAISSLPSEVSDLMESEVTSEDSLTSVSSASTASLGRKVAKASREDTLQSIPEDTTLASTEMTTDSDATSRYLPPDPKLIKLQQKIMQQKSKCMKDLKRKQRSLDKITKLERLLADKGQLDSSRYRSGFVQMTLGFLSTDGSSYSEDSTVNDSEKGNATKQKKTHKEEPRRGHRKGQVSVKSSRVSTKDQSPARTKGQSPARSKGQSPARTKGQSPDRSKSPARKKYENMTRSKGQSPTRSKSQSPRSRSTSPSKQSSRSKSPQKSKEGSKSPLRSQPRSRKMEDAPPMLLTEVRYDEDNDSLPEKSKYAYLEFKNPTRSHGKSPRKTDKERRDGRSGKTGNENRKRKEESSTNQSDTSTLRTREKTAEKHSIGINVPTPLTASPAVQREVQPNLVSMVSEAVQTTPSLRKAHKHKATSAFTPEVSVSSDGSLENVNPSRVGLESANPVSWFVEFDNTKPWRRPLKERQESTWPLPERQHVSPLERGTFPHQGIMDRLLQPEIYFTNSTMPAFVGDSWPDAKTKLSLQEAFKLYKGDIISRLRERQRYVNLRAEERHLHEMHEHQRALLFGTQKPAYEPNRLAHPYSDHLYKPKRRIITRREMKELTEKNYKKLPEVALRNRHEKRSEELKTNRLRAKLFAKKVQNKVLKRRSAWA